MSAHPELVTCPACGPQPQFQGSLWCGSKGNEEGGGSGIGKEAARAHACPFHPLPLPTPSVPGQPSGTAVAQSHLHLRSWQPKEPGAPRSAEGAGPVTLNYQALSRSGGDSPSEVSGDCLLLLAPFVPDCTTSRSSFPLSQVGTLLSVLHRAVGRPWKWGGGYQG